MADAWCIERVKPCSLEASKGVQSMTVMRRGRTVIAVADGMNGVVGVAHLVIRNTEAGAEIARKRATSRLERLRNGAAANR
jgi:hypothetical protein